MSASRLVSVRAASASRSDAARSPVSPNAGWKISAQTGAAGRFWGYFPHRIGGFDRSRCTSAPVLRSIPCEQLRRRRRVLSTLKSHLKAQIALLREHGVRSRLTAHRMEAARRQHHSSWISRAIRRASADRTFLSFSQGHDSTLVRSPLITGENRPPLPVHTTLAPLQ